MISWFRKQSNSLQPGSPGFYIEAVLALYCGYVVILNLTTGDRLAESLADAVANILPVVICGAGVRFVLLRGVIGKSPLMQFLAHAGLAVLFSIIWFWLLMVLLGAMSGLNAIEFSVRPFMGPAAAWQLFQGLWIYAAIALLVYCEHLLMRTNELLAAGGYVAEDSDGFRHFVKDGDEIRPLDPARIVQITGADDYAEVLTVSGTHMLRTTLNELERTLGKTFMRVHRSHIVNIDRIARIEPAGNGRLSLHMERGETVIASRAGAKAIRERVL